MTVSNRPLIHGHCVVYADPVFFSVNDMPEELRMKYWRDVCRVGDALIAVTGSYRINYETLCNVAQALHTHVIPRQKSESDDKRRERAAVAYAETDFDLESGRELIAHLRSALQAYTSKFT